jgi:hypothetical protein
MSIAALDARVAKLELSAADGSSELKMPLIALKKQRNALTPFGAAPHEVIVRIFANLTHKLQSSDSFFETEIYSPSTEWLVAMTICSRIRTVVMNAPALWSFIDGSTRDEWIATSMKHAGRHPLKLFSLRMSPETDADHIQLASSLLSNASLADIRCYTDQSGNATTTRHWLQHTFPPLSSSLQYLCMTFYGNISPTTSFLDGKCDNLVELSLSKFALLKEHPACPRLQRLKLKKMYLANRGYEPIMEWLRSLPLLEVLFLERTGTRLRGDLGLEQSSSREHTTQITMPHLRVLSIKENVWTTNALLEALPSPSQSLAVTIIGKFSLEIDDDGDRHLTFPLALKSPPTGLPEMVFTHVQRFWKEKIGLDSGPLYAMPSGRLILQYSQMPEDQRIQFGTPPSAANTAPSVFYDSACLIRRSDPALATVDTMYIRLSADDDDDERYGSDEDEVIDEDLNGLSIVLTGQFVRHDKNLPSIRHAILKHSGDPRTSRFQVTKLEQWLIERKSYTEVLETLRFAGRLDTKGEAWARQLEQRGLVGRVLWSCSLESSERTKIVHLKTR